VTRRRSAQNGYTTEKPFVTLLISYAHLWLKVIPSQFQLVLLQAFDEVCCPLSDANRVNTELGLIPVR
jgi:hypothetical protein